GHHSPTDMKKTPSPYRLGVFFMSVGLTGFEPVASSLSGRSQRTNELGSWLLGDLVVVAVVRLSPASYAAVGVSR
ncbi:hypothetical protein, partial [Streptomyces sp. NPDC058672]|uniref:hypothetical protein n=1 Tax=Streptomyces sp. NPDC058672 TaxID=3346591 RepID=UPI0036676B9C